MRKFKAIVRYQMADILFSMSVFFIVFAVCFGLGWAIIAFAGEGGTPFKGMYLWMCVFLGLCGGISYSIDFEVRAAMRRDPRPGVSEHRAVVRRGGARLRPGRPAAFGGAAPVGRAVDSRAVRRGLRAGLRGFAWTLAFNLAIVFLSYALVVLHGRVGKAPFLLGFWRSASWRSCWCPPSSRWCRARPTLQGRFFSLRSGSRLRGSSWRTPSCCSPSSPCCRRSPPTC